LNWSHKAEGDVDLYANEIDSSSNLLNFHSGLHKSTAISHSRLLNPCILPLHVGKTRIKTMIKGSRTRPQSPDSLSWIKL